MYSVPSGGGRTADTSASGPHRATSDTRYWLPLRIQVVTQLPAASGSTDPDPEIYTLKPAPGRPDGADFVF